MLNARVGVGAVIRKGDAVLLVRLNYGRSKGMWVIPSGHVDVGESLEEALCREVEEEASVVCKPERIVAVRSAARPLDDGEESVVYVVFEAVAEGGEPKPDGHEVTEAAYRSIDDVLAANDVTDLTKEILRSTTSGCGLNRADRNATTKTSYRVSQLYL